MDDSDRVQEIDEATCRRLLDTHRFGRVAVDDGRGPVILPVNYTFVDGAIVFRSDPGTKVSAAERGRPACFEIDDVDERRRFGWSVVVRGHLSPVEDAAQREHLDERLIEPFAGGEKEHLIRIAASSISGRRIPLPKDAPRAWLEAPDLGNLWYGQDAKDLLG